MSFGKWVSIIADKLVGNIPSYLFLWKAKELLGMENWGSCYSAGRGKARRKSPSAQGSYTYFSVITSPSACYFVPPPRLPPRCDRRLAKQNERPETAYLDAWEGRKSTIYCQVGRRQRLQRVNGQICGDRWSYTHTYISRAWLPNSSPCPIKL